MTVVSWAEVKRRTIIAFRGELPHAQTEQEIIDVFEVMPSVVLRAIDQVAEDVAAGKPLRSPWAILRKNVQGALDARDVTVDVSDRERKVTAAEAWIRNAGVHVDREEELEAELFGPGGLLHDWREDQPLRDRMVTRWIDVRPAGEQLERDAVARAEAWKANRELVVEAMAQVRAEHVAAIEAEQRARVAKRAELTAVGS